MRVVSREEFLKMPKYTVYSKIGTSDYIPDDSICVKFSNYGKDDFYMINLMDFNTNGISSEFISIEERMKKNPGVEYPGKLYENRDKLHEGDDVRFVIYDLHEIKQIVGVLERCLRWMYKRGEKDE